MLETVPRKPNKIPMKPLTLRVPEEMLERLTQIAEQEDRSLNAQVIRALREWLTGTDKGADA